MDLSSVQLDSAMISDRVPEVPQIAYGAQSNQ